MRDVGFGARGSGFRVQGSGFRIEGVGLRVEGVGLKVEGSGFMAQGVGFRTWPPVQRGLGFGLDSGVRGSDLVAATRLSPVRNEKRSVKLPSPQHRLTIPV